MKCKVYITSTVYEKSTSILCDDQFTVVNRTDSEPPLTEEDYIEIGKNYDVIVTNISDKITDNILNQSTRLKLISNLAVGFDNIDVESARNNHIAVATTPDTLSVSVAEHAVGLLLMATRRVKYHQSIQVNQNYPKWTPTFGTGVELNGKDIGIIGLGKIGQEIGRILHFGFNAKINYLKNKNEKILNYPTTPLEKEDFFKNMQIIIVSCPLNKNTFHMIDKKELQDIQKDSVIVNVARGDIINQKALLKHSHKFISIGLDVTTPDPLPYEHSLHLNEKFFITPHIASATFEARKAMTDKALENVFNFKHLGLDKMSNIVN